MKKILIYCRQIHAVNSTIAVSYRNAAILADELGADILMKKTDKLKHSYYDVIICPYFNRYTDYVTLRNLIKKEQKRYLLRTEYENVDLPREFKPHFEICNFEGGQNFLNTNLLISRQANKLTPKKYDCIYYSRHRSDRMIYCKEYLQGDIYLSTHPKNHKYFFHAGCRPKLIKHIEWIEGKETLNQFRYSLYIEDKYTHRVFNNLANRWYEAGFCNVVMFFDINCRNTIMKSELAAYYNEVSQYTVSSHEELIAKIAECNKDFNYHLAVQKKWRSGEMKLRIEMIDKLKSIILS